MASGRRKEPIKSARKLTGNAKYLEAIFDLMKQREGFVLFDQNNHFSNTEIRMIGEILAAEVEGRRLISTQLATLLGITRSAISQIVNRLESKGVIKRVDDDVDRKIAYIVVQEEWLEKYQEEFKRCSNFAGRVVKTYGVEKFDTLCSLFNEFFATVEQEQAKLLEKK